MQDARRLIAAIGKKIKDESVGNNRKRTDRTEKKGEERKRRKRRGVIDLS